MSKVICIANQKGGVGKTTTAGAFLTGLADFGYHVLGIDMDPQGNLSDSFAAKVHDVATAYELLKKEVTAQETVQNLQNIDIISANIMLAGIEQELIQTGKEYRLKETVNDIVNQYDYIIIDTPPSLGVLTVNAFTFSDEVIIPTLAGLFSANGIGQLANTVQNVKKYCNPNLKISGILMTRFNPRANICKQIKELTEQLGAYISAPLYQTYIRNSVIVDEAQAIHQDIFTYSSRSTVSEDYKKFIMEYLEGESNA